MKQINATKNQNICCVLEVFSPKWKWIYFLLPIQQNLFDNTMLSIGGNRSPRLACHENYTFLHKLHWKQAMLTNMIVSFLLHGPIAWIKRGTLWQIIVRSLRLRELLAMTDKFSSTPILPPKPLGSLLLTARCIVWSIDKAKSTDSLRSSQPIANLF